MDLISAIILAITEGISEFLPISSTGHMILISHLIGLKQSETIKSFEIIIQLGSILAVVVVFRDKLKDFTLWKKIIVAFIPTGIIGFLFYKHIKNLFNPYTTAYMLILWGAIFIIVEIVLKKFKNNFFKIDRVEDISMLKAFFIGLSQCFAMIPGTSRSGATIISSLLFGLDRQIAAKFSFLLAIPTMFCASGYDIYKNYNLLNSLDLNYFLIGFLVAFLVSFLTIKLFIKFISKFSYVLIGIYRIIIGFIFLKFVL